jgi:acyl-CoA dehydrogenase
MVLKHWENQGRQTADLPMLDYACQKLWADYEDALDGLLKNLPARPLAWVLRRIVLPYGVTAKRPNDVLATKVAGLITADTETRSRLIAGTYQGETLGLNKELNNPVAVYNQLLKEIDKADPLYKKISKAVKSDDINADVLSIEERIKVCGEKGILTADEVAFMIDYEERVLNMLMVDDFDFDNLGTKPQSIDKAHGDMKAA